MQYTEQEFLSLVSDVQREFTAVLAKATGEVDSLAKSEDAAVLAKAEGEEKPKEKKEDKPAKKESKEAPAAEGEKKPPAAEAAPAAEGKEAPAAEGKEAAPAAPAADAAAAPAAAAPGAAAGCYDAEDMAHLEKMYASMSREELICHHDAIKMALDASAAAAAPAPGAAPDALAAPAPDAGVDKMGMAMAMSEKQAKSGDTMSKTETNASVEIKIEDQKPSKEVELLKSEVAAEKAKVDGLQKNLDAVTAFITKLVEKKAAPQGKAITSLESIAKSEGSNEEASLSKGEITAILAKKAADPSLKKSDRDAINAYYLNSGSINSISHLLK